MTDKTDKPDAADTGATANDATAGVANDRNKEKALGDAASAEVPVIGDAAESNEKRAEDKDELLGRIPQQSTAEDLSTAAAVQTAGGGRSKLAILAFLLALVAAVAAGYVGWMLLQQQQDYAELNQLVASNQTQVRRVEAAVGASGKASETQIGQLEQQLVALRKALDEANVLVESHSRRLLALTATTTADWRIAEVEYLLRLANQRLLTSHDINSALVMLRASDRILLELDDPRLFPVRSAIAEDSAALAAVGKQDLEGIFLRLSALSAQIDALPIISVPEFTREVPAAAGAGAGDDQDAETSVWEALQKVLLASWESMQSWIVIQQRGERIKPLLPPEQQYYLRSNLRLLLNQAQIAALDGKEKAFTDSLASTQAWLGDYFPGDEAAVQAMQQELQAISGTKIAMELPDISSSLLAIKAFIREQHSVQQDNVAKRQNPVKSSTANARKSDHSLASVAE